MSDLTWFEVYPPRGLDLATATAFIRPLASRPKLGFTRRTPEVVFELRAEGGHVRWLLGVDERLAAHLPGQLRAQVPGVVLLRRTDPQRETPLLASNVRTSGVSQRLRLDMATSVTAGLLEVLHAVGKDESAVVQWVVGPTQGRWTRPHEFNVARSLGFGHTAPAQPDDRQHWRQKTEEPLFAVRGRIGARTALPERASAIVRMLASGLALANASHTTIAATRPAVRHARQVDAVLGGNWSGVLNAAELAALLGWPLDGVAHLMTVRALVAPAPPRLLLSPDRATRQPGSRLLGESLHPSDAGALVKMPVDTCLHHVHITGVTGSGKSTQLASFLRADMAAGHGVLLIEPRGDLVNDVLAGVPAFRRDDVVVIEPGRTDQVVGINPLAGPPAEAEQRADHLLHLFHELYGKSIGPRSSDVLLHTLIALARSSKGTLADVPVVLTNGQFRRRLLAEVTDPLVLAPFFSWYDGLSDAERTQVVAPVLNKTRAFLSRTAIRRLLGQATPRFQLDELFSSKRIVLVNLNSGIIGTETAAMIGALLMTQLWQAVQRQAAVPATKRHPVMVVVDEVQDYLKLPVDVGDMLAQARGLGVSLTFAHQHLGQLTPSLRAAFLANARSRMVFKPSVEDTKQLAEVLGGGLVADDLEQLGAFEACARLLTDHAMTEPFTVHTRPLGPALSKPAELRLASQSCYGMNGDDLDVELTKRWRGDSDTPEGPIGLSARRTA